MCIDDLSPTQRNAVLALQSAVVAKWNEAAQTYFCRAIIATWTSRACREAEFADAADVFAKKAAFFTAEGLLCVAKAAQARSLI